METILEQCATPATPEINAHTASTAAAQALPLSGIADHCAMFTGYIRSFLTGDEARYKHYRLKEEHTLHVAALAESIARDEKVFAQDGKLARALLLAALYHDLGRFRQLAEYGTFNDRQSVNHAEMSEKELLRMGFLAMEASDVRENALMGVRMHNRIEVPETVTGGARAVALAVRDADKLDILRIMRTQLCDDATPDPVVVLHVRDSKEVSPAMLEAALAKKTPRYEVMQTTADFRLLLCLWVYDLTYASSRRMAAASGHVRAFLAGLPDTKPIRAFTARFIKDMEAYGPDFG